MHKILAFAAVGALTAAASWALAPTASGLPKGGAHVTNIPAADQISGWQPLDQRHVLVSLASKQRYLLTLRDSCPGLTLARNVGVTMSNNTIWAGFDAITTDAMQCEIQHIERLEPEPGVAEASHRS